MPNRTESSTAAILSAAQASLSSGGRTIITPDTSKAIDALRVILIVLVIFIHYPVRVVESADVSALGNIGDGMFDWVQVLMGSVVSACAVPAFFAISGYLFFKGEFSLSIYLRKIKSRVMTLAVPYILWNVIALVCFAGPLFMAQGKDFDLLQYIRDKGGLDIFWGCEVWGDANVNWLGRPTPWTGPINFPLWYVRNLIVVMLLSPVIFYVVRYLRALALVLLFIAFCSGIFINVPGINATSVFFFTLGGYFSINKMDLILPFERKKRILIPAFIAITAGYLYFIGSDAGMYIRPFFIVSYLAVALVVARHLAKSCTSITRWLLGLSNSIFFIYASHIMVILLFSSRIPLTLSGYINSLLYLCGGVTVFIVCEALFLALKALAPSVLKYLNGNRV